MSRTSRLIEMLQLLSSSREVSVETMAERFGVTERTVFRDVAELQTLPVPLVRGKHGYRLMDGAILRPLNLNAKERAVLQLALANPALRRGCVAPQTLERVIDKLHAVSALVEEGREAVLSGPERTGEVPGAVSAALDQATRERRTVEIRYTSITTPGNRERRLDPYGLFHRQGVWYCAGHCHENEEMRTFRLDRITEALLTENTFEPADVDLEAFFADSWNVFQGTERHQIQLHVNTDLAPLFRRGSLHEGGEVRELDNGAIEYHVILSHLEEIARFVVGHGGRVRVLAPEALRARVREIAEGALEEP